MISCAEPQQLVEITQNHLENLHRLVGATPQLPELLNECVRQAPLGASPLERWGRWREREGFRCFSKKACL